MQVNPRFISGTTGSLASIAKTQEKLTQQLASGSRVNQLSDDSVAVSDAARIQSELSVNDTFVGTTNAVSSRMQVADSAMGAVVQQLTSAISLATQAANGTLSASTRATIVQQLQQIQSAVLGTANSSYQGQYLFSGSATSTPSFDASGNYTGDNSVQYLTTPTGQRLATNIAGDAVFSPVLAALQAAIAGASSGSTTAPAQLSSALDSLTTQRAWFGSSLASMQKANDAASNRSSELKIAHTELLSADAAQVATDLSTTQVQQKALLSVIASLGKSNLFDYM